MQASIFSSRPSPRVQSFMAIVFVSALAAVILFVNLARTGIWEPYEALDLEVAREYANNAASDNTAGVSENAPYVANKAVPTLNTKPVHQSLLKTMIVGKSLSLANSSNDVVLNTSERAARLPAALALWILSIFLFLWIRQYYGLRAALLTSVVFITIPGVFLSARFVNGEALFLVTTSCALVAYVQLIYSTSRSYLWGALFGVALSLAFLDQRLLGLYLPLTIIVGFALTEMAYLHASQARIPKASARTFVTRREIVLAAGALSGLFATLLWAWRRSAGVDESYTFLPHVVQWLYVLVPLWLMLAGLMLTKNTPSVKKLAGPPGLIALGILIVIVGLITSAYGQANPVLLPIEGEFVGKIPLLSYLLENDLLLEKSSYEGAKHFAIGLRQIGFGMLPWVVLLPLALSYLTRATRIDELGDESVEVLLSPQMAIQRLFLLWAMIAFVVLSLASSHMHYVYPAYVPLAAATGLLLADRKFWHELKLRPLLLHLSGFAAIAIIMVLGKDLERFPLRLFEVYAKFQGSVELPEEFSYGSPFKTIQYSVAALLAVFFFGLVSTSALYFQSVRAFPGRFKAWWKHRRSGVCPDDALPAQSPPSSSLLARAQAKERYRNQQGFVSRVARIAESPGTFALLMSAAGVLFAFAAIFSFIPELTLHFSQRGVYESYTRFAIEDEKLYRFGSGNDATTSYYLRDASPLTTQQWVARFDKPERIFAVIPEGQLASINTDVRRRFKRNVYVLDARSSRLLLVSNQLRDGEHDYNVIARAIVEDEGEIQHLIRVPYNNQLVHPTFGQQLEFLGYSLDRQVSGDDDLPAYKWGEDIVLTTYFRVLRRISQPQRIFLHVDAPGSRINGDHDPVDGHLPTNYWLPGDIIKDEYTLPVQRYTTPGEYTMHFGFFRGSQRMVVEPESAHDGQNRLELGKIQINSFF